MTVLTVLYGVSLTMWVGGMVMASAIVTPVVFKVLAPDDAGRFLGLFFPRYYRFGIICGLVAAGTLLARLAGRHFWPSSLVQEAGIGTMVLLTVYAGYGLHPKIRRLKAVMHSPATSASEKVDAQNAFVRLHRQSMHVNGLTLLVGLLMVIRVLIHE